MLNHKIISVTIIVNLAVYCALPAMGQEGANADDYRQPGYDPSKVAEHAYQRLAVNYNKQAMEQLQTQPDYALQLLHSALFYCPNDEAIKANLDKALAATGKNPHSFDDRVALADRCMAKKDTKGAMIEYHAALLMHDDPAILKKLTVARDQDMTLASMPPEMKLKINRALGAGGDNPAAQGPDHVTQTGDLTWHTNLHDAEQLAAKENKLVFVFLFANWCGNCRRTDEEVFTNARVVKELNNKFICVRSDVNLDENETLIAVLKAHGVPGMALFNADGRALSYFDGYRDPDLLLKSINQVMDMIPQLKPGQLVGIH